MSELPSFHTTQALIEEFRNARMVILVDDESRENEGDLVIAAQHVQPHHVNFMARYARGLICLPMTAERCDQIGVPPMSSTHRAAPDDVHRVDRRGRRGRHRHIGTRPCAHHPAGGEPGRAARGLRPARPHLPPPRPGGRGAHPGRAHRGSLRLARLAGLEPAAVIVEIMNEDGSMARRPDLDVFARDHQLKIGTIADLIEYRMLYEQTVDRVGECRLPTRSASSG